ncbi:hypothetical protein [Moraxella sp.]|uniref:hypothetical protein n=1 Tax=Moraxella sp. TaxID=479 RepID=UPI0026DCE387|nr:hypothetical protein [Moraxella sp.]
MNATQLFFGLVGLLVVLFGIALVKPHLTKKPIDIHTFKKELEKQLPNHDLLIKQDTKSRIIISLEGVQKAIVIMDRPREEYVMGGLPIFTTNKTNQLNAIAQKINQLNFIKH